MKRIAIFTSGEGECALRLVPLFNENSELRIELVVTDRSDNRLIEQMISKGVNAMFLPGSVWQNNPDEMISLLEANHIDIIALDDFAGNLPEKIEEMYVGKIVRLTSFEMAVGEIETVAGVNLSSTPEPEGVTAPPKSVDEEWAETLKIKFDPAQVAQTPPPIPGVEMPQPQAPHQPQQFQQPQYVGQQQQGAIPMPQSYLILSILSTVLCCTIPGIVAIIFSSQVSSKYYSGDIEGAKRASRNAEIWIIVSFVLGVLTSTLYLPIMLIANS